MFLKSLTLRGFKSFADKTVLEVEPGVTVIVGPNGSGKSNVVDGLAWVLGTHSARKIRGSSMSDVIFAGSPSRSALGRAHVEIVIDNSAGQLGTAGIGTSGSAQQFSEVRVSREIDADGTGTYRINGEECRALDVQELLSDTGLGRELHTIVGQGQLDEILNAKPEDRRAYIEEAAGILKHRRRRERALRKLDQVDGHIEKIKTVLRELRRQLRPLERQAEAANKLTQLQAELRDTQVRIAAMDLERIDRLWTRGEEAGRAAAEQEEAAAQLVADRRDAVAEGEQAAAQLGPRVEQAQATTHKLQNLLERLRGSADLVEAKRRHLVEYVEEPLAGRPPAELRAQAARIDDERDERVTQRDAARERFEQAMSDRRAAEAARREHEQARQAEARRRAEQRERLLRWEGEVSSLRSAIAAAESEVGRLTSQLQSLDDRTAEADADVEKVQAEIQRLDRDEVDLTGALEQAEARVSDLQAQLDELAVTERELERERSSQAARGEALRAALQDQETGGADLLGRDGVLGLVADHVRVESGAEEAVAAALGPLGEAVLASSTESARQSIAWLREQGSGRAVVLAARDAEVPVTLDDEARAQLAAAGATPVVDLLTARAGDGAQAAMSALRRVLVRTWVVRSWSDAVLLHGRHPDATFVTRDGDLAGPFGYVGGQAPERSSVLTATAAEDAESRAQELARELEEIRSTVTDRQAELSEAREQLTIATNRINESDAQITGAAERLARLNKELHSLANQQEIVRSQRAELQDLVEKDREALAQLNQRGPEVDDPDAVDTGPDDVAVELDEAVDAARERELEARVVLERMEEQLLHLERQARDLRREADEVERALEEAARRRELRRQGIVRCHELAAFCEATIEALQHSISDAMERQRVLAGELSQTRTVVNEARERLEVATTELEEIREARHSADLQRSELQHERDDLLTRLRKEFGVSADELRAEHPDAVAYDRETLVQNEDTLVRKIGLLGRVNPLALEEFHALEERHSFLSGQLEDLRASKRDLEEVVVAVDDKIRDVFRDAYEDVASEFERIFGIVFPGGRGRLVLTDPDDMLATGIEIEARPPGKKVKRLSLLSGGERSLTVLAFVFAIFSARPSPFYVLDEVDAALDDVNLQRLLQVIQGFKGHAQIIMVTHQKRSMEIADLLYGITMGPDAVTKVVAERLDDIEDFAAAGNEVPAPA